MNFVSKECFAHCFAHFQASCGNVKKYLFALVVVGGVAAAAVVGAAAVVAGVIYTIDTNVNDAVVSVDGTTVC